MDFVIRYKGCVTAIEVTSSLRKDALPDMDAFAEEFRPRQKLLIGGRGIPLEKFLSAPPRELAGVADDATATARVLAAPTEE